MRILTINGMAYNVFQLKKYGSLKNRLNACLAREGQLGKLTTSAVSLLIAFIQFLLRL